MIWSWFEGEIIKKSTHCAMHELTMALQTAPELGGEFVLNTLMRKRMSTTHSEVNVVRSGVRRGTLPRAARISDMTAGPCLLRANS
jgi:hypothetical protein